MTLFSFVPRPAMVLAAAISSMVFAAEAAETKPYCTSRDPVVNKLDQKGAKALADWLKDNDGKPAPMSFKVPGLASTRILCKLNPTGLKCFEVLEVMRCPEAVDVDTPSGTTTVPVDCTGPDANGECDCDFEQG